MIEVIALERRYGDVHAVRGLTFSLHRGITGLLGPNGAGKSSTLQMLAGTLAPTHGSVRIAGISLADNANAAKRHIGFLPEQPPLYREQTVDEYLRFCIELRQVPRADRTAALHEAKDVTGLSGVGHRVIGNLSKGYQQRLGIAQAIAHKPAVIILDEPTVGLDPNQIREVRALLVTLGERYCVLLSTHILAEVQAVCARVLVLHQGKIVLDQGTTDLAQHAGSAHRIRTKQAVPEAILEKVRHMPGVHECDDRETELLVRHNGSDETLSALVDALAPYGLRELTPAQTDLEELFVSLTMHSPEQIADEHAEDTA